MKKKIYLTIMIISIIAIVVNLSLPFQTAKACNTWDSNYNWLTGECDLPPSGERPEQGRRCYYPNSPWHQGNDYATICVFQVVPGSCTPRDCPYL